MPEGHPPPAGPGLEGGAGCGPLISPEVEAKRPLKQRVFERIRAVGLMPRVQVSKELGISPASVTQITSELIEAGYLQEVTSHRDPADAGRGRPPVALGVRGRVHLVAGVKLSDREHTGIIVDFAGNQVASASMLMTGGAVTPEQQVAAADRLLDQLLCSAGFTRGALSAVGVGVPGFVDHTSGCVYWSPVLQGRDIAFAQMMEAHLGLPVYIDNDANLVTLAELWFGAGREVSDFAVISIEHGVGSGLVLNHKLFRGSHGLGMELGHTKVHLDGALCRCGQRGCLEAYVADYALAREAHTALNAIGEDTAQMPHLLESLFDHAKAGNTAARSIFRRAGRYLAVGLANVVNLIDPPLIILSGERMRYDYIYAEKTLAEMDTLALNTHRGLPTIRVQAWGDLLWARGAAALALSVLTERHLGDARSCDAPEAGAR